MEWRCFVAILEFGYLQLSACLALDMSLVSLRYCSWLQSRDHIGKCVWFDWSWDSCLCVSVIAVCAVVIQAAVLSLRKVDNRVELADGFLVARATGLDLVVGLQNSESLMSYVG